MTLEASTQTELADFNSDCEEMANAVTAGWAGLDWTGDQGRWWPRTQTTAAISLADGDVVITMRPDAELGGPAAALPTVLVEVKANALSPDHTFDLNLYALGIALRDGLAPALVLHWSPGNGWVPLPPTTADVLESAARRLAHALDVLGALARGETPEESPEFTAGGAPMLLSAPRSTLQPSEGPANSGERHRTARHRASTGPSNGRSGRLDLADSVGRRALADRGPAGRRRSTSSGRRRLRPDQLPQMPWVRVRTVCVECPPCATVAWPHRADGIASC